MLEVSKLTVAYGDNVVINELDWRAGDSDSLVTVALGPSGCGKSTLLRAIAGLQAPRGGQICFDGADLASVPPHRRDFGVVFQDGQLFSGRTVEANVAYGLRRRGWSRSATSERVAEMLDLVELSEYQRVSVDVLSGGQAQRIALARALAPRPRLLLLDEPLAALDRQLREQLAVDIATIVRATATPTVMVTHDQDEAAMLADKVSVLNDGAVRQTASPEHLWRNPIDEWTARFLGCTTILPASVDGGLVRTPLGEFAIDRPGRELCAVGLRPDAVVASVDGAGASGRVVRSVSLPDGVRLLVATDVGDVDASAPDGMRPEVGDVVGLSLVASRVALIGPS